MREPLVIEISDPSLVVLVGAAGAGKTTFAARHFVADEVLSSDALREAISGDAGDQRVTAPAFAALHRGLTRRLHERRLTVVDATNVTAAARTALLRRARQAGVSAVAIVLDLPADLVLARNAARPGRAVPEDAVRRQLDDLRTTLARGRLEGEGFARVVRLRRPAEVDAVAIRRRVGLPMPPPTPS